MVSQKMNDLPGNQVAYYREHKATVQQPFTKGVELLNAPQDMYLDKEITIVYIV